MTVEETLHRRIREAGLRLTAPRRAICKVLALNGERFLTAAEILAETERLAIHIDSSTAYRTLDELSRIGVVHHVVLGTQPGKWHLTIDHDHQHLICESCERTILVPRDEVRPMFDHFQDRYGFSASAHHFAIIGHCRDCRPPSGHPHG